MAIKLRALEPSDLDLLYELENDTNEWTSSANPLPYSRYSLKQYILRSLKEDVYSLKQMRLVIEEDTDQTKRAVGFIDLCDLSPLHRRAEVGVIIFPHYRNHGYAKEALCLLSNYALSLSLHQLYAYVLEENPNSQNLFQKAGFQLSGTLYDWFLLENCYKNALFYQKRL